MTLVPVFHSRAIAEVAKEAARYKRSSKTLAQDFLAEVAATLARAVKTPERFMLVPVVRNKLARRVLLHRFPFSIIYVPRPDTLWIVALAHYKRRPGYWLRRIS